MKKTILSIFFVFLSYSIWTYASGMEVSQSALKCTETEYLVVDKPIETVYYLITSKFFNENDVAMYVSNPDTDKKGMPPYLTGVSIASDKALNVPKNLKHYPPLYYVLTSIFKEEKKSDIIPDPIATITYLNRDTLDIETITTGDDKLWSNGKCVIIDKSLFYEDWNSKVKMLRDKMKI